VISASADMFSPDNLPSKCSFCEEKREDAHKVVRGPTPDIAICDECIDLFHEIIRKPLTQ